MRLNPGQLAAAFLFLVLAPMGLSAAPGQPATGAGVVNVRDFGALGDGRTDDTAAILAAIRSVPVAPGRIFWKTPAVYLPTGTYLVSRTIERRDANGLFTSGLVLKGDGRGATTIRLADAAPGFDDPDAPRPVVMTSARLLDGSPFSGGKNYFALGEGNDAYANYVEDLTVDVGELNPGAVALDYLANNIGAVRRVTLVGRPGSGAVGLSMRRKWIGPALISDLRVEGFETGVAVGSTEYGITLADIAVEGARRVGLRNEGNLVAADDLSISVKDAPAIENADYGGLIVLDGAKLAGTGGNAIANAGFLNLSNIEVSGFDGLLPGAGAGTKDGVFSPDNKRIGDAGWSIPKQRPPAPAAPVRVADITQFGAVADPAVDSTAAIRAAFASGADTIDFPYGTYMVTDAIEVPPTVTHIRGNYAAITVGDRRVPSFERRTHGIFRIAAAGPPLKVDKLTFDMTDRGGQLAFQIAARRTLALEDIVTAGVWLALRPPQGGELFVSNACCGSLTVAGPEGVWLQQFNSEAPAGVRLRNSGAPVRVLGMKTEQEVTAIENSDGGTTEVHGGFFYPVIPGQERRPLVMNHGGRVAVAYAEEAFRSDATYAVHLASAPGRDVSASQLPVRNQFGARIAPFLVDESR